MPLVQMPDGTRVNRPLPSTRQVAPMPRPRPPMFQQPQAQNFAQPADGQVVRMPDGQLVRFPADMPPEQIRGMIETKFPDAAAQAAGQQQPGERIFTVKAPDGRQIQVKAGDQATALRGAQEWAAANPAQSTKQPQTVPRLDVMLELERRGKLPANLQQPLDEARRRGLVPSDQGGADQVTVNIGGQRVKVGAQFLRMSPDQQNATIEEIAGKLGIGPNGAGGDQITVRLPNGETAKFPAGTSQAVMESALREKFPANGGSDAGQQRLAQIGSALQKADAAGNVEDARALASAYKQLQGDMAQLDRIGKGIEKAHAAGNESDVRTLGAAYRKLQGEMAQQPSGGASKRFEVKTPDGRTFEVTAPDMESASASITEYLAGNGANQQVAGPSREWLAQNPSLADLPIPGTGSANSAQPMQSPQPQTGAYANATAGLNNALYSVAGFPVDASNTALRMGAAGINAATGSNIQLPENTPGGRQSIADAFGNVGVTDPANVQPANNFERSLRAGGEGAGYAIAPELMLTQLSKLGIVGPKLEQLMGQIFGNAKSVGSTTGNMIAGAGGGMGAQAAADAVPEQWKGTAAVGGGLAGAGIASLATAIPSVAKAGGRMAADFMAPLSNSGRERLAGQQLREGATSPGAVLAAIDGNPSSLIPGSKSTTFQMSGDMGLGAMERGAATRNPAEFQQRSAAQNSARLDALEGLQPNGSPEAVVTALRSHLKTVDDELQTAVTAATRNAQGKATAIGTGTAPEVAGEGVRASLEAARAAAKAHERALWSAVDPQGTLALSARTTKEQSAKILADLPASAKRPGGEEGNIFGAAHALGDSAPFSEITALQSRIKTELRAERLANGESPAWRRLSLLNTAVQKDLETAIIAKVAQQAKSVEAGRMRWEETIAAKLRSEAEGFFNARKAQAGNGGSGGFGGIAGSQPQALSSAGGAKVPTGRGFGYGSGNSGLSPNAGNSAPNFDAAALERLNAARQATKQRANTFDNQTLGPIRKRPSTTAPYDMPAATVAARLFSPGAKSPEALQSFRAAVGDGPAFDQIKEYAIDRLRKAALRDDGTFDPGKLQAWRRNHADALRTFPELDASLANAAAASETMAKVAAARETALAETQKSILGKLLGLNDPQEVNRAIGSILGRGDASAQMLKLRVALKGNKQALEGLKRSIIEYTLERFVGNAEAATSGRGGLKSDQFQTFVARNRGALRAAGFDDDALNVLERLALDLQRANRSNTAVRLPGGSNTAQDVLASRANDGRETILLKIIATAAAGGGGVGFLGGPVAGAATMLGAGVVGALRQKGLTTIEDLITDALLNPERARYLMLKASPGNIKLAGPSLAQQYRRAATAAAAAYGGGN